MSLTHSKASALFLLNLNEDKLKGVLFQELQYLQQSIKDRAATMGTMHDDEVVTHLIRNTHPQIEEPDSQVQLLIDGLALAARYAAPDD